MTSNPPIDLANFDIGHRPVPKNRPPGKWRRRNRLFKGQSTDVPVSLLKELIEKKHNQTTMEQYLRKKGYKFARYQLGRILKSHNLKVKAYIEGKSAFKRPVVSPPASPQHEHQQEQDNDDKVSTEIDLHPIKKIPEPEPPSSPEIVTPCSPQVPTHPDFAISLDLPSNVFSLGGASSCSSSEEEIDGEDEIPDDSSPSDW
ncbi:hypothetical protein P9112_009059 [Eukaryota sp. TZLM1-RC]